MRSSSHRNGESLRTTLIEQKTEKNQRRQAGATAQQRREVQCTFSKRRIAGAIVFVKRPVRERSHHLRAESHDARGGNACAAAALTCLSFLYICLTSSMKVPAYSMMRSAGCRMEEERVDMTRVAMSYHDDASRCVSPFLMRRPMPATSTLMMGNTDAMDRMPKVSCKQVTTPRAA